MTAQSPPSPPGQPWPDQPDPRSAAEPLDHPETTPPPPPPGPPAAVAAGSRRIWLVVALAAAGGVLALGAAGFAVLNLLREELPQVGDCLNDAASVDDMHVVACDSAEAAWAVVGEDGVWTRGDFDAAGPGEVCQAYPTTEQAMWVTSARSMGAATEGKVVCLEPLNPAPTPSPTGS